jgi:hypothetical protein
MTGWYIFDVMRKYRGRRNVWVALLANHDPDDIFPVQPLAGNAIPLA